MMLSSSLLLAWAEINDPHLLSGIVFAAGVCLIYADNLGVRLGGGLLSLCAGLFASGPPGDPDNWLIPVAWVVIAIVVIVCIRPRWLKRVRGSG